MTVAPFRGFVRLLIAILTSFLPVAAPAKSPAYTDDQLDIVNKALEKWKPETKYPAVKDMFRDESYKSDWNNLKEDGTVWDAVPDSFKNEREALRAGCKCDFIKDSKNKTCLLKLVQGQSAWIFVYDQDAAGKYVKSGVIEPPTWYGIASVTLVDISGTGQPKFILIEHQGASGTGVNERIHWLIGWHDGAFRTVLRETVFSGISSLGADRVYRMNYKIVKGKHPRIEARYSYDAVYVTAYPYDFHSTWKDWLFWDETTFSFYDPHIETEKIKLASEFDNKFSPRLQAERNRMRILKLPPFPQSKSSVDDDHKYWKGIGLH